MPSDAPVGFFPFSFQIPEPAITSLPPLRILNSTLITQSKAYFTIEENAQASKGCRMAVHRVIDFNPNKEEHLTFLEDCTSVLERKAADLKLLDLYLLNCILGLLLASTLSFLPLLTSLSYLALVGAGFFLYQRAIAYTDYHDKLVLLVAACHWSLGPIERKPVDDGKSVLEIAEIKKMLITVYPLLTKIQRENLIANDILQQCEGQSKQLDEQFRVTGYAEFSFFRQQDPTAEKGLQQRSADFMRHLYGLNQGTSVNFLNAFMLFAYDVVASLKHKWQAITTSHPQELPQAPMN